MYYYVINPAAGKGAINHLQDKLRARLNELGISGEFAKTTGPGDATKMAQAAIAKGYTTIVAVGGDETVNEVINGINKDNVAIGIIPLGRTNRLANHLGIYNWQQSCPILAERRLTAYSLIAAGQKFFLSSLSLGFETDLDKNFDTQASGWRALLRQLRSGWGHAQDFKPLECKINIDDKYTLTCSLFSLSVANQKFVNPLADNRLIISISNKPPRRQMASYIWQLFRHSSPLDEIATTRITATRLLIETKPPSGIMLDGKVTGRTPIAIRLTDRRIRFITEKPATGLRG